MSNVYLNADYHCHTLYSDGQNSPEEMVAAAIDAGLTDICVSDHMRRCTEWFDRYKDELRGLKEKYSGRINVFCGVEVKILDLSGALDAQQRWLDEADFVLGAMHSLPAKQGFLEPANHLPEEEVLGCWKEAWEAMCANAYVDILAHPFAELKCFGIKVSSAMEDFFMHAALSSGKMVEINLSHPEFSSSFIKKLSSSGVKLVLGSDAHSCQQFRTLHLSKGALV